MPATPLRSAFLLARVCWGVGAGPSYSYALARARAALGGGLPAPHASAPGAGRCDCRLAVLHDLPSEAGAGAERPALGGYRGYGGQYLRQCCEPTESHYLYLLNS